jgi:hypothetical protein
LVNIPQINVWQKESEWSRREFCKFLFSLTQKKGCQHSKVQNLFEKKERKRKILDRAVSPIKTNIVCLYIWQKLK